MQINALIHIHTNYSYDGKIDIVTLRNEFAKRDVQCVFITEHTDELDNKKARQFIDECRRLSDEKIILIPGFEIPYMSGHILIIGVNDYEYNADSIEMARTFKKSGALVILAHPHRSYFNVSPDLENIVNGIEIWNSQYDGKFAPRFRSINLLKKLRLKNNKIYAVSGIDFHRWPHFNGPKMVLSVNQFSEEEFVKSLSSGNFLISKGKLKITPAGDIQHSFKFFLMIMSQISIITVKIGKKINSVLKKRGLSFPKKIKEEIRKKI